jgi:hypothetical protein
MIDNVENLVLEHLRAIRADMARMERKQDETITRLGRLELAVLWTAWILVATLLEERDLVTDFGEAYRQYCKRVPMLIPWRGPARTQPAE